ncbi:MAG TPA: hypothetical protein PLY93_15810, partial [Turneriella sp.]|nr:hypothetical protein [Turneriella sp.]
AASAGYLAHADSRALGNLMVELGAGRKKSTDAIDDRVTLEMLKAPGTEIKKGDAMARIYKPRLSPHEKKQIDHAAKMAFSITKGKPKPIRNILKTI